MIVALVESEAALAEEIVTRRPASAAALPVPHVVMNDVSVMKATKASVEARSAHGTNTGIKEDAVSNVNRDLSILCGSKRSIALFNDMVVVQGARFRSEVHHKVSAVEMNGFVCNVVRTYGSRFFDLQFGADANKLLALPNAGGNSKASEALSLELLVRQLNAKLECTEMELEYFPYGSKITDYSVRVGDEVVGVSVTRAMKFDGVFSEDDARVLLEKKLYGVVASSKAVLKKYRWNKQILHIMVEKEYMVPVLHKVWRSICRDLQSNTVVVASVCSSARWVFYSDAFSPEEVDFLNNSTDCGR